MHAASCDSTPCMQFYNLFFSSIDRLFGTFRTRSRTIWRLKGGPGPGLLEISSISVSSNHPIIQCNLANKIRPVMYTSAHTIMFHFIYEIPFCLLRPLTQALTPFFFASFPQVFNTPKSPNHLQILVDVKMAVNHNLAQSRTFLLLLQSPYLSRLTQVALYALGNACKHGKARKSHSHYS